MKVIREKNAPDFLIVGAAKSGTTSLWYYLNQHPQIFMNQGIKELGYFSDHYGISDLDEYLKHFDGAKPGQRVGEACHAYLSSEESARKIYEFNPGTKILIILRNPVERAYSLYNWMTEHGHEHCSSFEKALELENVRINDSEFIKNNEFYYMNYLYFRSGLYFEQVKRYYDLFPPENIHLIVYELFRADNKKYLSSLFKFLGVEENVQINLEKQNQSKAIKNRKLHFFLLNDFIKQADRFFVPRRISQKFKQALLKQNQTDSRPAPLSAEVRKDLSSRYAGDIKRLTDLVGIDFSKYWN
jgi:hypothetical protein